MNQVVKPLPIFVDKFENARQDVLRAVREIRRNFWRLAKNDE